MGSVSFLRGDIGNLAVAVAEQFQPNMAKIVALIESEGGSQTRDYVGVVEDMTSGTASYVPFVAEASALNPGYSRSTLVTLHKDKAEAALNTAVTNAVALIGTAPDAQAPAPAGAEEPTFVAPTTSSGTTSGATSGSTTSSGTASGTTSGSTTSGGTKGG